LQFRFLSSEETGAEASIPAEHPEIDTILAVFDFVFSVQLHGCFKAV
jgi:hypothetical protein